MIVSGRILQRLGRSQAHVWSSYEQARYRLYDTHKLDSREQASPAEAQFS
jgi:hypothetical protein